MKKSEKFVFLESNTTGTGALLLRKALTKCLSPVFVTSDPKKYSFLPLDNVDLIILDTTNKSALFDCLSKIENLIGIYSSSEYYIEIASWLANKLDLPGTDYQATKVCRNKYLLYQKLKSSGIRVPYTQKFTKEDDVLNFLKVFNFPFVIKPSNGSGSKGVKLCKNTKNCLDQVYFLIQEKYSEILMQEYIDGDEFSVEVCTVAGTHNIIGITRKYISTPPFFVETGHDFPANLLFAIEEKIKYTVSNLLNILDFDFGFSHIELKIRNDEIIIIEVNPRLAGGMIPVLIEKSTGIDLLDCLMNLYTNRNINLQPEYKNFAAIRHIVLNQSCNIKNIEFKDFDGVEKVEILRSTNENFISQGDFRDRVAYIIVSDTHEKNCIIKATKALENFVVEVES